MEDRIQSLVQQCEDKLKILKCGTKTCGLAEEEQGWV